MVYDYFDKRTFLCEMYDEDLHELRELVLHYFPFDNSVRVIDVKRAQILLKRVQVPTLKPAMLQMGNIVNIFSKFIYIRDCTPLTRKQLFNNVQSTFALIKPVPASAHGKIITFIMKNGFRITKMKNGKISKDFAMTLYSHLGGSNMMPLVDFVALNKEKERKILVDYVTSGETIGLELVAPDAIQKWRDCLGTTDPKLAEPGTLRALYGETILRNVAHGCHEAEDAAKMIEEFFGYENGIPKTPFRATFTNCSCCIIKPHVIIDGNVGAILEHIANSEHFCISAMAMFSVRLNDTHEFYEVYDGVVSEYKDMTIHLAEGKCIVLEIISKDPEMNTVCEFRKLCGPRDPDVCRQLYPDTIRALYGKDIVHNAVHCTDLQEDGVMEVEYFFKLLANE